MIERRITSEQPVLDVISNTWRFRARAGGRWLFGVTSPDRSLPSACWPCRCRGAGQVITKYFSLRVARARDAALLNVAASS